jgi:hypothetical protein
MNGADVLKTEELRRMTMTFNFDNLKCGCQGEGSYL